VKSGRRRRLVGLGLVGAFGLWGTAELAAQNAAGSGEKTEVTVPMQKKASLSPDEMRQQADKLIQNMQRALQRGIQLQNTARRQKDVIKLNCINDKLLQIKQLLNIAEQSRTNMVEAIAQNDEGGSYHQYSQVTIAHEKVSGLLSEAEGCIGEEIVFVGETKVTVDEPELPDDDPTDISPEPVDVEPPGYASPFN
jgi:hypothetical protein